MDELAPRQVADGDGEIGIGGQRGQRDVMDMGQIGRRVDAMLLHQPGKRGAVAPPVVAPEPVGLGPGEAERLHHPIGHPHLDLVEEPRRGRIERVVEVEDPGGDMVACAAG